MVSGSDYVGTKVVTARNALNTSYFLSFFKTLFGYLTHVSDERDRSNLMKNLRQKIDFFPLYKYRVFVLLKIKSVMVYNGGLVYTAE